MECFLMCPYFMCPPAKTKALKAFGGRKHDLENDLSHSNRPITFIVSVHMYHS